MPIQVLPAAQRNPSFLESLGAGLGQSIPEAVQGYFDKKQQAQKMLAENEQLKKMGIDLSGIQDPKMRQAAFAEAMKGQEKRKTKEDEYKKLQEFIKSREPTGSKLRGEKPQEFIEEEYQPKYTGEELALLSQINSAAERALAHSEDVERRESTEKQKMKQKERLELQKQRQPFITDIINKANASRKGIKNKQELLSIIDRGDLDDPTWAIVAEELPFNLGKRMLSEDTVTYKAGLVDEFTDLRNIFQGQTRVKELDILQEKLADLYLTDSQKKAILKSRINALQTDLIREEAASYVEEKFPHLTPLQFNKKVDEETSKRSDAIGEMVIGDIKNTINQAELRKKIPLDPSNPEDKNVMMQILKEAGNNKEKAKKIAKEKGYSWVGM